MIQLNVIDNDSQHFIVNSDQPVTIEVSVVNGRTLAHVYDSDEVDELSDPVVAFDGTINNVSWKQEGNGRCEMCDEPLYEGDGLCDECMYEYES